MKFCINRNMIAKNIQYTVDKFNIVAKVNHTWGILPIKIQLSSNISYITIKQVPFILKIINSLPLLNIETLTPFKICKNNEYCGKIWHIPFKPVFMLKINSDVYELRSHSNNYISAMKNNVQIALFQREMKSVMEKYRYYVKCIDDLEMFETIVLLCVFADAVFFPNQGSVSYLKWEKICVPSDKYIKRTEWNPVTR